MKSRGGLRRGIGVALTVGVLASVSVQAPALATHPGTNGKIAFWVFNKGQVKAVEPDGSGRILIAGDSLVAGSGPFRDPAWSPDGTQIAYVANKSLMVASADGTNATEIAGSGSGVEFGWLVSPSWSGDGTQIAVLSHIKGTEGGRVTIVSVADGSLTQIGPHKATDYNGLDWSPTGSIAFLTGFSSTLHLIQPDGSGSSVIDGNYLFDPSWSPDGSRLAVSRYLGRVQGGRQRTDIMTMDADGSGRQWVTSTPKRWEWTPAFSPDGSMIAYSRTQTRDDLAFDDIWMVGVDGSGAHRITDTPNIDEFGLDWQPLP